MSQTLKEKYDLKCKELSEKKYDQEFFSGRRQDDAFTDGFNAALELAQKDVDELRAGKVKYMKEATLAILETIAIPKLKKENAELKAENEKLLRANTNLVEENDGLRAAITRNKLNNLAAHIHKTNVEAGWWTDLATGEPLERNVGELLCLVHSEVSEALEAYRKSLMDDKLPHRTGFEVELADALIRIFDIAGKFKLDLDGALEEKMAYNAKRADHKLENRQGKNGKKF